jgi:hypothetical protein
MELNVGNWTYQIIVNSGKVKSTKKLDFISKFRVENPGEKLDRNINIYISIIKKFPKDFPL